MVKVVCRHDRGPQALRSLRKAGRDGQVRLLALLRVDSQKATEELAAVLISQLNIYVGLAEGIVMEEDARILESLEKAVEDSEWVSKKYDELIKKYEGKVFAVKNGKVIEDAATVEELCKKLEAKKEDMAFLLIESIPPKNASFIL